MDFSGAAGACAGCDGIKRVLDQKFCHPIQSNQFGKDVLRWTDYDYVVINDDLQKCYLEVNNLIKSEIENIENSYNSELIKDHVNSLIK